MEKTLEEKRKRIEKHIKVLKKAYDNIVEVMQEDVDKKKNDAGQEEITLKDDKIKTYAEGLKKSAETLEYLFAQIESKELELVELTNPEKSETKAPNSDRNKHLE